MANLQKIDVINELTNEKIRLEKYLVDLISVNDTRKYDKRLKKITKSFKKLVILNAAIGLADQYINEQPIEQPLQQTQLQQGQQSHAE